MQDKETYEINKDTLAKVKVIIEKQQEILTKLFIVQNNLTDLVEAYERDNKRDIIES